MLFRSQHTTCTFRRLRSPFSNQTAHATISHPFHLHELPAFGGGDGVGNVAVGYRALYNNTQSLNSFGIAIGYDALFAGGSNRDVAIGYQALYSGSRLNSQNNIAIGNLAMYNGSINDGNNNIAIGTTALYSQINNAAYNIAIGNAAGDSVTSGDSNVLIGTGAGGDITTGTGNVVLGGYAGKAAAQNNNIAIADGSGNLRMFITGSNGFVGINTDSPGFGLDVNASLAAGLSTAADNSNIVSWNSATDEVQYVPSMSIDTGGFNPSGSSGTAANNTWLVSRDGFSLGASSQVYNGYFSTILSGGPGTYTLLTIPQTTYASIWFEYTYADNSYTNMKTQTFAAHWNDSSTIEFTNRYSKNS